MQNIFTFIGVNRSIIIMSLFDLLRKLAHLALDFYLFKLGGRLI